MLQESKMLLDLESDGPAIPHFQTWLLKFISQLKLAALQEIVSSGQST